MPLNTTTDALKTGTVLTVRAYSGIAGDMMLSGLIRMTGIGGEGLQKRLAAIMPDLSGSAVLEPASVQHIAGWRLRVSLPHQHEHRTLADCEKIIAASGMDTGARETALAAFRLVAGAEGRVHGAKPEEVHFHEVGMKDAVADIVGNCVLIEMLQPDHIYASAPATGKGTVMCAHGLLPVPAPATAELLKGIPNYAGKEEGELLTPTGAALLKYFIEKFEDRPAMNYQKIGYGMGKKDFQQANCLRAYLSDESEEDTISELACNIDDETAEEIAYASELLMKEGALDVSTIDLHMKKNRPGYLFVCMCRTKDREKFLKLMFRHLTTLGIREYVPQRYALHQQKENFSTSFGSVGIKVSEGYGTKKTKLEYEDLARIAKEQDLSIAEVRKQIEAEIQDENNQ